MHSPYCILAIAVLLIAQTALVCARDVIELQGINFELAITSYKYIAILFYDDSVKSKEMEKQWLISAMKIDNLPKDCEVGKVDIEN